MAFSLSPFGGLSTKAGACRVDEELREHGGLWGKGGSKTHNCQQRAPWSSVVAY